VNIAIIGAGNMGRTHANAVRSRGARVVAVLDVRLDAARALADSVDADVATTDFDVLFDRSLDGIVVATPPAVRVEPVRRACERGIALMIEKPPALAWQDGQECQRFIERSGVLASVGLQLRYQPLYERLREMLVGETVHLIRTVCTIDYYLTFKVAPWFLQNTISGGPLAEQAIHILDAMRFVLGDPKPVRAHALAVKNMAHERTDLDAENAVQMTYELDNGAFGTHLNHCGTERFAFDLEVVGPRLRLHTSIVENRIRGYRHGLEVDECAPPSNSLGLDKIGAWLRAIETQDFSLVRSPYANAMDTLALILAAIRSRGTGRFVRVEELV
jgi:predicted dehydrogenase